MNEEKTKEDTAGSDSCAPNCSAKLVTRRQRLAEIADEMREKQGWFVGRTDLQSFTADGTPEHYAYPPQKDALRVRFTSDDPDDALARALAFARYMNSPNRIIPDCEVIADVRPIDLPNSYIKEPSGSNNKGKGNRDG